MMTGSADKGGRKSKSLTCFFKEADVRVLNYVVIQFGVAH